MDKIHEGVIYATGLIVKNLTDDEAVAISMSLLFGSGFKPEVMGYEKLAPLFTQNSGESVRPDTMIAFKSALARRIDSIHAETLGGRADV